MAERYEQDRFDEILTEARRPDRVPEESNAALAECHDEIGTDVQPQVLPTPSSVAPPSPNVPVESMEDMVFGEFDIVISSATTYASFSQAAVLCVQVTATNVGSGDAMFIPTFELVDGAGQVTFPGAVPADHLDIVNETAGLTALLTPGASSAGLVCFDLNATAPEYKMRYRSGLSRPLEHFIVRP